MNCARSCENLLNFVRLMPKILLVPFFSGHGVVALVHLLMDFGTLEIVEKSTARPKNCPRKML